MLAALPDIIEDPASGLGRQDRLLLNLAWATDARERRDDGPFEEALLAAQADARDADDHAAIAYQRCLHARDRLDHRTIAKHIGALSGTDPAWALRKSAMQAFLQDRGGATRTAYDALLDIRARRARDRRSIWLLSREAWAHHVVRSSSYELPASLVVDLYEWPSRYREANCDPWDNFTNFDHDLMRSRESLAGRNRSDEPSFVPGIRRTRVRDGQPEEVNTPFHELLRLADHAGFARMPSLDVIERRLQNGALLLGESPSDSWNILLTVRDWERGFINERFNRIAVARLAPDVASEMIDRLKAAIDFGLERSSASGFDEDGNRRHSDWVERTRVLLELLSRLAIRLDPAAAIAQFQWACKLTRDQALDHWWLFEPLGHLLDRTLDAVPPAQRGSLATDILNLPQPGEREMRGIDRYWPTLAPRLEEASAFLKRDDPAWHNRINAIIALLRSDNQRARSRALTTLYVLHKKDLLTADEQAACAQAIWSPPSLDGVYPVNLDLLPWIFLDLPEPTPGRAASGFRQAVLPGTLGEYWSSPDVQSVASAPLARHAVTLSEQESVQLVHRLLSWRPPARVPSRRDQWREDYELQERPHTIAGALGQAVLPTLPEAALTDDFIESLFAASETIGPDLIEPLPALVRRRPDLADRAFAILRRALVNRSADITYPAARGLYQWVKAARAGEMALPASLPGEIAAVVASRREPALRPALSLAAHLVAMGLLSATDQERLAETLDVLEVETAYTNQDRGGLRDETLTLVRANCVRLAVALSAAGCAAPAVGRWLAAAPVDPIPEVRFAAEVNEE